MKLNKTPLWAILLVAGCTLLLATGQVMMKLGTELGIETLEQVVTNPFLWVGLLLYTIAAFLLTYALKYGELSVLYPVIALGFVWVTIASVLILHETLSVNKIIGITIIICGISLIGRAGR